MTNTQPTSKTKRTPASETQDRETHPVEAMNDAVVDAFVKSTETYVDWLSIWNREVAQFMARRLSRQQDFARKACKCEDGADLVECQREWTEQAQQDYADEFRKLTDLGLSFVQKQSEHLQKQ